MLAVLFATARRGNGFAALRDVATGTRVVERHEPQRERGRRSATPRRHRRDSGSIHVLAGTVQRAERDRIGTLLLAAPSDPVLRPRDAAIDPREALQPRRVRWLAGQRLDRDASDAFEAVDVVPLSEHLEHVEAGPTFDGRLLDVAGECAASRTRDRAPRDRSACGVLGVRSVPSRSTTRRRRRRDSEPIATDQQLLIAVARSAAGRGGCGNPTAGVA